MIIKIIASACLISLAASAQLRDFSEIRLVGVSGMGLRTIRPEKGKAKIVSEFVANEGGAALGGSAGYAAYDWERGVLMIQAPPFGEPKWLFWIDRRQPDKLLRNLIPMVPNQHTMDLFLTRDTADERLLSVEYIPNLNPDGTADLSGRYLRPILRIGANGAFPIDPLKETQPLTALSRLITFGDLGGYGGMVNNYLIDGPIRDGKYIGPRDLIPLDDLPLLVPNPKADRFSLDLIDPQVVVMNYGEGRMVIDRRTKERRRLKGIDGLNARPMRSYGNWLGAALLDSVEFDKGPEPDDPMEAIQKFMGMKARKQLWLYEVATGIEAIVPVSHRDSEVLLITPDGRVIFRENDRVYGAKIVGPLIQQKTLLCQDPWIPFVHWAIEGQAVK